MSPDRPAPRIAIGGFMLESNNHAPVATRAEFEANEVLADAALLADLRPAAPRSPRAARAIRNSSTGMWPN